MPRPPIHPGEHLRIDLEEIGMSPAALARELNVPKNRISQIIRGERGITADTASGSHDGWGRRPSIGSTCKPPTSSGKPSWNVVTPFGRRLPQGLTEPHDAEAG